MQKYRGSVTPGFTNEQIALLARAAQGDVLITAIGSDNDILWADMAERGWMEAADIPQKMVPVVLSYHAWKLTEAGIDRIIRGSTVERQ